MYSFLLLNLYLSLIACCIPYGYDRNNMIPQGEWISVGWDGGQHFEWLQRLPAGVLKKRCIVSFITAMAGWKRCRRLTVGRVLAMTCRSRCCHLLSGLRLEVTFDTFRMPTESPPFRTRMNPPAAYGYTQDSFCPSNAVSTAFIDDPYAFQTHRMPFRRLNTFTPERRSYRGGSRGRVVDAWSPRAANPRTRRQEMERRRGRGRRSVAASSSVTGDHARGSREQTNRSPSRARRVESSRDLASPTACSCVLRIPTYWSASPPPSVRFLRRVSVSDHVTTWQ